MDSGQQNTACSSLKDSHVINKLSMFRFRKFHLLAVKAVFLLSDLMNHSEMLRAKCFMYGEEMN